VKKELLAQGEVFIEALALTILACLIIGAVGLSTGIPAGLLCGTSFCIGTFFGIRMLFRYKEKMQ